MPQLRPINADQGFRMPAVLATAVQIPWAKYKKNPERGQFYDRVLAPLRSTTGAPIRGLIQAVTTARAPVILWR